MIIYPPHIGDTVPAFSTTMTVNFSHNPGVGENEVQKMWARIRSTNNNYQSPITISTDKDNINIAKGIAVFDLSNYKTELVNLSFYKIQIAYDDETNTPLTWSAAAVGRYLAQEPTIEVEGLTSNSLINLVKYQGVYKTTVSSEGVYDYCFEVSYNDEVVETSGWLVGGELIKTEEKDVANETIWQVTHPFEIKQELEKGKTYKLKYAIHTLNGLYKEKIYSIYNSTRLPTMFTGLINVEAHSDGGYIKISLSGNKNDVKYANGTYELQRLSPSGTWDTLAEFTMNPKSKLEEYIWEDYSVEQGTEYIYAIAQINGEKNYLSERLESKPITVDFEDSYLSDGEKQLRITFNLAISSFKDTILETKTDTIGGQYPFFFRNGMVKYKEFPITGLVSYQQDDRQKFMTDEELGLEKNLDSRDSTSSKSSNDGKYRTNNQVGYNFTAERRFKLAVLDWLNNGKPKLYRSAAEGNYVVRLMNVSMAPNTQLGRMIDTFSATCYEYAATDYEILIARQLVTHPQVNTQQAAAAHTTENWIDVSEKSVFNFPNGIFNLTYETRTPGYHKSITLTSMDSNESITLYNMSGRITTPEGAKYSKVVFNNAENDQDYVKYSWYGTEEEVEIPDITFSSIVSRGKDKIITIKAPKESDRFIKIYYLVVQSSLVLEYERLSQETYVVLTDNKKDEEGNLITYRIDLTPGSPIYYQDLPYCTTIKEMKNANVVIYGRYVEEANLQWS